MSVRDEIMMALCRVEMGDGCDDSRFGWQHHADALMPIVERVAREAVELMHESCMTCITDAENAKHVDAIVRRVVGDE